MTRLEAQFLLDVIYMKNYGTAEQKELAYCRLSELISLLLPEE